MGVAASEMRLVTLGIESPNDLDLGPRGLEVMGRAARQEVRKVYPKIANWNRNEYEIG